MNSNPIERPILTPEEELAFVDRLGWARGEVRRLVRSVLVTWEGEPEPRAILDHVMIRLGPRGSPGSMSILLALAMREIAQIVAAILAEPN